MAEQERKPKAERRAEARAERKRAEEEAARAARRQSIRNAVFAIAVIAVIVLVMIPTVSRLFGGGEAQIAISQVAALEARQAAGCTMDASDEPMEDSTHVDPTVAPPADVMYAASAVRPNHSGPHFGSTSQPLGGVPSEPLDERAVTHNLEHGAVIVWFNPDVVDGETVREMGNWMRARQDLGFDNPRSGGSVFVSPFASITDGKAVAMRAWGQALNCDSWDQTVADSFLIDYYGPRGISGEGGLSPYPSGALDYAVDDDGADDPTDDPTGEPTDGPTGEPTDDPTGEPTDDPTGEPTGDPTGEPTGDPTGEPTDTSTGQG